MQQCTGAVSIWKKKLNILPLKSTLLPTQMLAEDTEDLIECRSSTQTHEANMMAVNRDADVAVPMICVTSRLLTLDCSAECVSRSHC